MTARSWKNDAEIGYHVLWCKLATSQWNYDNLLALAICLQKVNCVLLVRDS